MYKIINIIPLKRKKQLLLEMEGESSYKIQQETLVEYNLYPGYIISKEKLDEIIKFDQHKGVKNQALRYLAGRSHSSKELENKLLNKGFEKSVILKVLDELKERNYLNDNDFLKMFIKDRLNFSKKGRNVIIRELLIKGFKMDEIEPVLSELTDVEQELEKAIQIAQKKWVFLKNKPKSERIIKVKQHLLQKGYPIKVTEKAILKVI